MDITRRSALLAGASLAVAPSAVQAQKAADTLRILFLDAVPNIDMYFNSQRTGLILAHQAWDMLVHRDPATFEIKPALATDWKLSDTSLDLNIRKGVKFHDGSALTADDVVYTIAMASDPGGGSTQACSASAANSGRRRATGWPRGATSTSRSLPTA